MKFIGEPNEIQPKDSNNNLKAYEKELENDVVYFCKKLDISRDDLDTFLKMPVWLFAHLCKSN